MFNSLSGTITGTSPQKVFLATHGIEWDITVPGNLLLQLPAVGQEAKLYVWLQHTDALMNLYGFATETDRNLFFDLLKVDGIGPKGAIKILSNVSTRQLAALLESGDLGALEKVPGVGKKTAQKMLLQLKGKLSLSGDDRSAAEKTVPYGAVVQALVDMGYERRAAEHGVSVVVERLSAQAGFSGQPQAAQEDSVFRHVLVELAQ
ncbi:MAG: Holliday junction branch migration protein RuvA [Treponema sp.]|nr:Holliday junction branch migration protein RuvA [Treponema sp.]